MDPTGPAPAGLEAAPPELQAAAPAHVDATVDAMAQVLKRSQRVLITGHADPDGDVAGGTSALHVALKSLGKDSVLFNPDPFPAGYRHLPGCQDLVHAVPDGMDFDATVILDAAHPHQVDAFLPQPRNRRGTVLWIDHHPRTTPGGDLEWIDEDASAMGEMLHTLLGRMGLPISVDVGMGMYATLLADTGGFRYESTTARALQLASWLVEQGVKPWDVAEQVYERQPVERVRLLGRLLASLEVSPSGVFASVTMTRRDLQESGAVPAMCDGMINHARGIDGVEMAGQFEELPDGRWRVTLRSRGGMPARDVAILLGERGHRFGATFACPGPLEDVKARVSNAVESVARSLGTSR